MKKYSIILAVLLFATGTCKSQITSYPGGILGSPQIYISTGNHSIDDSTMLIHGKKVHLSESYRRSMDSLADTWPIRDTFFESNFHVNIHKEKINKLPIGERIAACGKLLLGKPYIDKSLEVGDDKTRTVKNFEGYDCVTFFETTWALAMSAVFTGLQSYNVFGTTLTNHRYRKGQRMGFWTRLHYTSDYFYDNAKRGNLKEMTREIGGSDAKLETKPIDFMTKHPNFYPQLKDDPAMVAKMDSIEKMINARGGFYYIPKEDVEDIEKGIHTGDLIGITTSIPGIDCSHTGIAIRQKDGRIHFMHASSAMHKVIISPTPLAEYLAGNAKQTGIMVYRPLEQKYK